MRPFFTVGLACLLLALTGAPAASAADICWDALAPSSGGDWSAASNWAGGVAPGAGDTAVLDTTSATCSSPTEVQVSADTSVDRIRQGAGTTIVVDGGDASRGLTLAGVASQVQVLGDVRVRGGGYVAVAPGAEIYAGGTITLGDAGGGSGTLRVAGSLRTITARFDVVEPAGGGSVWIATGGSITYGPGTSGVLNGRLGNDGAISLEEQGALAANLQIRTSGEQATSAGVFSVSAKSKLTLSPTSGTSMLVAAGAILSGAGTVEVGGSVGPPGAPGTVSLDAGATLDVGTLAIGSGSALELAPSGSAAADTLVMAAGDGRRSGGGALTATTAQIHGGHFSGGLTKITGAAEISGGTTTPAVHDGATLLTQGSTAWAAGNVTLGGAGPPGEAAAWQNTGTLTVGGSPSLLAAGDNGLLRNAADGSLIRDTPGAMTVATRIENAGTITLLAGSIGAAAPLPAEAPDLVQTSGATSVAAGAALGMDVTLSGGTLSGAGTLRALANSAGTVAPGPAPATLSVDGDFSQGPDGTLAVDIAGAGIGQFDRLIVGENANLDGTLAISSAAGYAPARNTTFRIVQAKARSGAFAQLTGAQAAGSSYAAENLSDGSQLCFGCGPPGTVGLTVALSGAGAGTVTSDPAGIICGADCAEDVPAGTNVTLTAAPAAGSVFTGWSGVCEGLGPCVLTMDHSREVTATFAPVQEPEPRQAAAPVTTPPAAAPAAALQVAGIVAFPSAKRCLRSPALSLRLRIPRGLTAKRASVTAGRRTVTLRGGALARPVRLRLQRGRSVRVRVTITLSDGRTVRETRVYRVCTSRR